MLQQHLATVFQTFWDQQLQALTNPILQSYKAYSSHKVWKMTNDSRLAVLANQTNIENARLQEVVKLVNS